MREELQALKEQALAELGAVTTPDELKDLRIKYLGKKGPMTEILRGMAHCRQRKDRKSDKSSTK